jgi:RNA polymerase sigma-70 factor (ECF subfamily)
MTQRTYAERRARGSERDEWDWAKVRALCLREARRVLGSSCAADDAAQEATIRAWRYRTRCRNPARPEPWIAGIARREALRAISKRREEAAITDRDLVDPRQDLSGLVDSLDLWRAMSGINGQDQRLLVGHYWQDLPNSELAMQLGLAEVTVRVRLHRLRRLLRERMGEI